MSVGRIKYKKKMTIVAWVVAILALASEFNAVQSTSLNLNDTSGKNTGNEIFDVISDEHPHEINNKPSKFDMDIDHVTMTDDKSSYQIESSNVDNSTRSSLDDKESSSSSLLSSSSLSSSLCDEDHCATEKKLSNILDKLSKIDEYNVTDNVQIVRSEIAINNKSNVENERKSDRKFDLLEKFHRYAKEHVVRVKVDPNAITSRKGRTFFDAFGLKKLLLPLFFGVQILKSVLLALFLPSIIGSIGNIVGKGVSSFTQSSQTATVAPEENFEFKDNSDLYNDDYLTRQPVGTLPASTLYDESMMQSEKNPEIASRYSFVDPAYANNANTISNRYYMRHAAQGFTKKQDFKVFHEIPTSSLLLTNYDPFYSPLLSRLDAVFYRLGHTTEGCREYAVCAMYRSPARYAPYSNLVSAQLSRELNELRKPASDNPDVLRFFRYMKAAKDGQDGVNCEDDYNNCPTAREDQSLRQNQAMLATYQDIDKLVHARKL
ncbi:PREDICTED: uncharacterized protein LOC106785680 isoform X2 [Polistes canadensis]|uniref:uncharacterized protein LOC106785680 isoform X2 n=1 Tax=Polistes canadensis TaxID=91411 RepID=UPI000718F599|nr:PREDICTED: uncharacterized protein LOC106785680 isoform X2 [Polistes canadensis]